MRIKWNRVLWIAPSLALAGVMTGASVLPSRTEMRVAKPITSPKGVPTFSHDIAPMIYQNCTTCHRSGQIAPFPLVTYRDVQERARQIAAVTDSRYMPPWKAEPGWGEFHGARRLTDAQIATLAKWAGAGGPAGNLAQTPRVPNYPVGWQLGTPDLIVKMPKAFTVPADGPDLQECFAVPISVPKDEYVMAYEFRPSNPRVVHHALFYTDASGVASRKQAQSEAEGHVGYASFGGPGFLPSTVLGAWVPGTTPQPLPPGIARPLYHNNDLVIQTHFHSTGKVETEQSELGLYFAKVPPKKLVTGVLLASFALKIPPGDKNFVARDSFTIPVNCEILSIQPHAHLLCKDMKVTATLPDGTVRRMIWIKDWDWNWQGAYQYAHPMHLPKGSRLDMVFTYDNSSDNLHNPNNPPQWVHFGEQTKDEMALCGVEGVADDEADVPALKQALGWHLITNFFTQRSRQAKTSDHAAAVRYLNIQENAHSGAQ